MNEFCAKHRTGCKVWPKLWWHHRNLHWLIYRHQFFFRSLMMRSSVDGQDSLVGIMLGSRYHWIETTYLVCRDYPGNQELMPSNDNYTASCGLMVYALGGQTMFQLSPEYQNSRENAGMELNMFLCFIMVKDQKGILQCFIHSCIIIEHFQSKPLLMTCKTIQSAGFEPAPMKIGA